MLFLWMNKFFVRNGRLFYTSSLQDNNRNLLTRENTMSASMEYESAAKKLNYYLSDIGDIKPMVSAVDFPDSIPIVKVREDIYTKEPVARFKVNNLEQGKKYSLQRFLEILQCPAIQPDLGYSGSLEMLKMIPPTKETIEAVSAWTEHGGEWETGKDDILMAMNDYKSGKYPVKYDPKCPRCGHTLYRVINNT